MEFSDWITKKYINWRGDAIGNDKSISDFAKYIGVPQSTMSSWMKKGGKTPTSNKTINLLVDKFGNTVYDVLGLESTLSSKLDLLPTDIRFNFESALDEIDKIMRDRGISPNSSEGFKIVSDSLLKFGFTITDIE